jgi:hypothetical protein
MIRLDDNDNDGGATTQRCNDATTSHRRRLDETESE